MRKKIVFALLFFILLPYFCLANIGVGVGSGKIKMDESLKAGGIYEIKPLTVLNTGDEGSEYGLFITYHTDQPELRVEKDWVNFKPSKFYLDPAKVEVVNIKLNLPVKTKPGDYFCYLEARPVKKAETPGASIGIAAASKFYFTVAPANIFQGIYYRMLSLVRNYSPWSYIVLAVVIMSILIAIFKKNFNFQISVGKKNKKKEVENSKNIQEQKED